MTNFRKDNTADNIPLADVLIIGGGPAGMSAALWCSDFGRATLIERSGELGGQLLWIHNPITNYPGIETKNGRELRNRFAASIAGQDFFKSVDEEIVEIDCLQKSARGASGKNYSAKSLIVATGVRRRTLGIPGEIEFRGRGILES
ncbi:MAG: NAD(P)/FAD-dependent oxidoreductase, partial [Pyrinomonadaceae bacterium]